MIKNVLEYLRSSAKNFPNKVAFADSDQEVTFGELNKRALELAWKIREQCGEVRKRPIAVYMKKSVDCIIAFMGIAYSGNFYSPLDISSPLARNNKILEVLKPMAVIYAKEEDALDGSWENIILSRDIDDNVSDIDISSICDVDPLYVLFTSGSTGQPKGVVISHRSVIDYAEWLEDTFSFDEHTVFGNQAPFYFDNSILDIYSTLKNAAATYIIPDICFTFHKQLFAYLNEHKINTLFWVPSALVSVANGRALDELKLEYLEKVLFCGEVMPNKQLNIWRKAYPEVLYANLYGPTEITDVCAYYIVDRDFADDEPLPIGVPCANTEIIVLDEDNKPVVGHGLGELCVRGTCLSLGYYDNTEKTESVFVQNPLNPYYHDILYRTGDLVRYNERGEIEYVCRKDFQIKLQGHRIELGEIETATLALPEVGQACALYDEEKKRIILLISLINVEIGEKQLYQQLKVKLPWYMLPGKIILIDELPLNLNGKIDRVRLRREYLEDGTGKS